MIGFLRKLDQWERQASKWSQADAAPPADESGAPLASLPLLDFIPALTPRWSRPEHLAVIAEALDDAVANPDRELRLLFSVPPQHGKTELVKHALVKLLLSRPESRNGYASYNSHRAWRISRQVQGLAERAGLAVEGTQDAWSVAGGGGLVAAGPGGTLTGEPIDGLLLIDDPHKNRKDANSATRRQDAVDWYRSTAETRCHPGTSIVVVHTRWHPEDLIGQLAAEGGWTLINLPAINDGSDERRPVGAPLWPAERPLAWLEERRRKSEYEWESLYQGRPRPRGAIVFSGAPHYYDELPTFGYRDVIALDLAYSAKTSSDWSVAVVLRVVERDGKTICYVVDVVRVQGPSDFFAGRLQSLAEKHPDTPMHWRAGGTEIGVASMFRAAPWHLPVQPVPIKGDKLICAEPVAAAWNRGEILLPKGKPWVAPLVAELGSFTGLNDLHDDQVDTLGTAYDAALRNSGDTKILRVPSKWAR